VVYIGKCVDGDWSRVPRTNHRPHLSVYKPQTRVWLAFFLDFFTLDDGSDRLSQNVRKEVPLICCVISQKSADLVYFMAEARNLSWGVSLEGEVEVNSEIDFKKYVITVSLTPLSQVLLGNLIFYYWFKKYADLCNKKSHYSLLWGPWFYIHFYVCKNLPLNCTEPDESHSDWHIQLFVAMSQVSRNLYII